MNRSKPAALLAGILALTGAASAGAQAVGREVVVAEMSAETFLPAAAYNSSRDEFLVVWHCNWGGYRDIWASRLDRFGKVLGAFIVATGGNDRAQPAVAYDSQHDRYLVVWSYDFWGNGSDWDVYGRLVPWNGPDPGSTEFVIWETTDSQWNPKVAYSTGDDEYVVVWTNTSASPATVSFRLLASTGTPGYAATLAGDGVHDFLNPDITYSWVRNEYLVAYEIDQADVAVRRVSSPGNFTSEVLVANWPDAESAPAVATCPGQDQWLVGWKNGSDRVYGRYLHGDGTVDGGPFEVGDTVGGEQRSPAMACHPGGGEYLIAWEQAYSGPVFGIWGRRLGADGAWRSPAFGIRGVYTTQLRDAKTPAIAGGALGWSVAWIQEREGSIYSDVHAKMAWSLFADDFETGNTSMWSTVSP